MAGLAESALEIDEVVLPEQRQVELIFTAAPLAIGKVVCSGEDSTSVGTECNWLRTVAMHVVPTAMLPAIAFVAFAATLWQLGKIGGTAAGLVAGAGIVLAGFLTAIVWYVRERIWRKCKNTPAFLEVRVESGDYRIVASPANSWDMSIADIANIVLWYGRTARDTGPQRVSHSFTVCAVQSISGELLPVLASTTILSRRSLRLPLETFCQAHGIQFVAERLRSDQSPSVDVVSRKHMSSILG